MNMKETPPGTLILQVPPQGLTIPAGTLVNGQRVLVTSRLTAEGKIEPLTPKLHMLAHVQVTVALNIPYTWSGDCPREQVRKEAYEKAMRMLASGLGQSPFSEIVGEPEITLLRMEQTG